MGPGALVQATAGLAVQLDFHRLADHSKHAGVLALFQLNHHYTVIGPGGQIRGCPAQTTDRLNLQSEPAEQLAHHLPPNRAGQRDRQAELLPVGQSRRPQTDQQPSTVRQPPRVQPHGTRPGLFVHRLRLLDDGCRLLRLVNHCRRWWFRDAPRPEEAPRRQTDHQPGHRSGGQNHPLPPQQLGRRNGHRRHSPGGCFVGLESPGIRTRGRLWCLAGRLGRYDRRGYVFGRARSRFRRLSGRLLPADGLRVVFLRMGGLNGGLLGGFRYAGQTCPRGRYLRCGGLLCRFFLGLPPRRRHHLHHAATLGTGEDLPDGGPAMHVQPRLAGETGDGEESLFHGSANKIEKQRPPPANDRPIRPS